MYILLLDSLDLKAELEEVDPREGVFSTTYCTHKPGLLLQSTTGRVACKEQEFISHRCSKNIIKVIITEM